MMVTVVVAVGKLREVGGGQGRCGKSSFNQISSHKSTATSPTYFNLCCSGGKLVLSPEQLDNSPHSSQRLQSLTKCGYPFFR